jgi:hypothetical protein
VTWWWYIIAVYYTVNFVVFWVRFARAEARAKAGEPEAVTRFNAMLRGFPNAIYAKMFGKRPLEIAQPETSS